MKKLIGLILVLSVAVGFFIWQIGRSNVESSNTIAAIDPIHGDLPSGRYSYEISRLADPRTGEIPPFIRQKEMKLASRLAKVNHNEKAGGGQVFTHIGPYNVGGRTRALAIDVSNPSVYFAGAVSGHMWRSTDEGASWTKVSAPNSHAAVSCIVQDTRAGKTDTWYYGSGESIGNSASKSFSAYYRGSGIYKSTDGGLNWSLLSSTTTPVNKATEWDVVHAMAIDASRNDSDIVYAALKTGIFRSNDGGSTWKQVLDVFQDASFTSVQVSSTGVVYATISSNAGTGSGFWRSVDGINWKRITTGSFPSTHVRTVFDIAPSDEDILYFFSGTPGAGANGASLWKYEYLSGDGSGSGGSWTNLSDNFPDTSMNLFNGYCMVMKIKPDNPDVLFVGGNNLYRSLTGFQDTINNHLIGGYSVYGDPNYNTRLGYQHPDQQNIVFHPTNPDVMLSSTDGGVHKTLKAADTIIQWTSLNNGYLATQFYGIGIDHGTSGSNVILGGMQDQGTYWTNSPSTTADWVSIRGSDGAYVAVEDGGGAYYLSTQYANIRRMILDNNGDKLHNVKVQPPSLPTGGGHGWLFVHPFTLDPVDNNIMYLPYDGEIWRNDNLVLADSNDLSPWEKIEEISGTITCITASEDVQGDLIFGTSGGGIYRIKTAHSPGAKIVELISNGISTGAYASCIAIDPNDNDKIIVVYSNYNVISLWYTEDGGQNWESIEGNLVGDTDPGIPAQLYFIGNGPSIRWAEIIPTSTGNRYFIGTSIGLFSSNQLNGDSTVWVQEGESSIGNVVVDMLDYRAVDNFLAVGTHGNGIYTTTVFQNYLGQEKLTLKKDVSELKVFPNPVNDQTRIHYSLSKTTHVTLELFDMNGRKVMEIENQTKTSGDYCIPLDVSQLNSGIYHLRLLGENIRAYQKLVKP